MEATPLPADKRALVAIDLGAESCRVSLLRWRGGRPEMSLVHRFANHAVESAAGLHWDLSSILAGLDEGLARCAGLAEEGIRSVAVDGWAVDYVRLSPRGEPIGQPFCYRDERTVAAMQTLHQRISADRMRALTGIQVLRLNTAYQMFADSANQRGLAWLNLPEYVLYRMGARAVSERTNASHTQLLGLDGAWCAEILGAIELPHAAMPELIDPGTDIGQLSGPLAELPAFAHTRLIAPACHDTASAIAAIPDGGDDWAYISSGTWSLVGTLLDAPNNSQTARSENFTNLVGANGKICLHKNVNGMWLLRQCLESWAAEGFALDLPTLIRDSAAIAPPPYVLDVDDPDLLLSGRMPQRINAQLHRRGLAELSVHAADAVVMAAFLFHSLAARYAEVLASITKMTGCSFRRLYVLGGGSQNETLNRLTAQATGLTVCKAGAECSTLGNFAVQLATLEKAGGHSSRAWAARLSPALG